MVCPLLLFIVVSLSLLTVSNNVLILLLIILLTLLPWSALVGARRIILLHLGRLDLRAVLMLLIVVHDEV